MTYRRKQGPSKEVLESSNHVHAFKPMTPIPWSRTYFSTSVPYAPFEVWLRFRILWGRKWASKDFIRGTKHNYLL